MTHLFSVVVVLSLSPCLFSQVSLQEYIESRTTAILEKRYPLKKETQTSAISLSQGSTSLVDQSAGADLVNMATSFGFGGGNGSNNTDQTQAGVVNASLYGLVTYLQRLDPLNPDVYKAGKDLRRFSVSAGQEAGVADIADFKSRASVFGIRALVVNKRDALDLANDPAVSNLKDAMAQVGGLNSRLFRDVVNYIIDHFIPTLSEPKPSAEQVANSGGTLAARLTDKERAEIDARIEAVADTVEAVRLVANGVYNKLRRKPQLAIECQTSQRPDKEVDIHRVQLMFDAGLNDRVFLTLNGGYEYTDFVRVGADLRGGRAAAEIRYNLNEASAFNSLSPVFASLAAESKWMNNSLNVYRGQIRFSIPVSKGVTFPISVGYSSRPELLTESGVYGKFGLEFDFAKLAAALR